MGALLLTLLAAHRLGISDDPCRAISDEGRPFLTCFDAGKGVELGVLGGLDGLDASSTLSASVRIRGVRDSRSKQGTVWFNDHRAARLELRPAERDRAFFATAYEGVFRRHVDEGYLLLPTRPPVKLPFPFDIGLAVSVARFDW